MLPHTVDLPSEDLKLSAYSTVSVEITETRLFFKNKQAFILKWDKKN